MALLGRACRLWRLMSRRKPAAAAVGADEAGARDSLMRNVLSLMDLTLLGIGATLGTGVYILAGQTAYEVAGPGVVLSFLIAALASLFAALCYAELASVAPSAGTAYSYSYVGIGEFPAFFVGWNLLLEYAIATASVSRAFSNYVDAVAGNVIKNWSMRSVPLRGSFLAEYPGFLALGLITLLAALLSLGVKESSLFNNVCTFFNLVTISITVVAGAFLADPANWSIAKADIPAAAAAHAGQGGFLPFGVSGVLAGAAKCFFAYVGFDTITACGLEARNPRRNIPLSIMLTLAVIFLVYMSVSTVATMMVPYYEQDVNTPFPSAFEKVGLPSISWIVTVGGMFAMCTSMVGSMFPLPRVLLSMAGDGMLFRSLARVSARTGTSLRSTLLAWALSGSMAVLFNLEQLIDMMSIGTLNAYIVVAVCVVQLRYREGNDLSAAPPEAEAADALPVSAGRVAKAVFNCAGARRPSELTAWVVTGAQILFLVLSVPASYMLARMDEVLASDRVAKVAWVGAILVLLLLTTLSVAAQPRARAPKPQVGHFTFRIPLVPFLPYFSILVNMSLMMMMNIGTWTRFSAWMLIGLVLYFLYGIRHSSLTDTPDSLSKPVSQSNSTSSLGKATEGPPREQLKTFEAEM